MDRMEMRMVAWLVWLCLPVGWGWGGMEVSRSCLLRYPNRQSSRDEGGAAGRLEIQSHPGSRRPTAPHDSIL